MKIHTLTVMALLAAAALHAENVVYYVSSTGSDTADGKNPETPYATLKTALGAAKNGDKIKIVGTITLPEAQEDLQLTVSGVELFGDGPDKSCLDFKNTDGGIKGHLKLTEGSFVHDLQIYKSRNDAGVLRIAAGEDSVVVSNCWINGNYFTTGGSPAGIFSAGLVTHCLFTDNSNNNSDGPILTLSGTAVMRNCIFTGNTIKSNFRGPLNGVINLSGNAIMDNCVVYGNRSKASETGDSASATYRPRNGGGIHIPSGSPVIRNSIIRDNLMPLPYMENPGETDILNATVESDFYILPAANPTIENCNIPEGQVPECAVGCQSADPKFTDPDNATASARDFSVAADSPCVDAGRTARWMIGATDFTGVTPRYQGQGADIGAYEVVQSETPLKAYIEMGGTTRAEKYATAEMSAFLIGPNQSGGGVFTWYTSDPQSGSPSPIAQGNPAEHRFTAGTWTVYLEVANAGGAGKSVYASLTDAVVVSRGADYYVKADGDDANSGDIDAPFATVEHAVAAASLIASPERRARIKIVGTVRACSAGVSLENMELYGDSREDCVFQGPPSGDYSNAKITVNGNSLLHTLKIYDWRGKGVLTLNSDSACISNVWAASLRFSTRGAPALNATAGLVTHCLFTSCKCNYGQVFSLKGTAKMRNSILTGNYISIDSDVETEVSNGLFNIAGSAELENNTIYSNYALKRAVNDQLCAGVEVVSGSPRIRNNIIRNNRINGNIETGTICNYIVQEGANPIVSNNNSDEGFGSDAQSADPKFADPDNATVSARDFSIAEDSPCIDAGRGISWRRNSADYAGNPRIQGRRVDIGAYEYNSGVVNWGIFLRMR